MKVLITSEDYTFQTGGVTNVIYSLEKGLRDRGHEVKVLALSNRNQSFREGDSYYIRSVSALYYPEQRFSVARHDPLLDELVRWHPDIIHSHTESSTARMAREIAKSTHAPIVMTTHTDFARFLFGRFHDAPVINALFDLWGRRAYRSAERIIAPSEKARNFARLRSVADRVRVIPNGLQMERYQKPVSAEEKAGMFRRYGLRDNGCTLVMVTRVSKEKNVAEILRYFPGLLKELPEAQLVITGDGPERKRLEAFCTQHGLTEHIRFTGRIDPDEVYRYYAMGDAFVSASVFEVHSMAYLEAMACGLPLICREDASLKGVLDNGENGFIYRTEEEFREAAVRILRNPQLRESMHEKALARVQEFTDRRFTDRTIELYEEVLQEKSGSDPQRGASE